MCRSIEGGVFRASLNGTHFLFVSKERNGNMALIKCPECGRENVSDTAESCPTCGYGIKAHFDKIKKQQWQKQSNNSIDSKVKITEEQKFHQYEYEMKQRQQEIDKLTKPKKPNFILSLFRKEVCWLSCLILIGPTLTLLFCKLAGVDFFLLILYIALGYLATPIWMFICYGDYKSEVTEYKKEVKLFETNQKAWELEKERKKKWIEESYKTRAHFEAEAEINPKPKPQTPKVTCPICGSDNVERITTMDRSVSIAMVGLASGKIGKQYKCKKCKHMW